MLASCCAAPCNSGPASHSGLVHHLWLLCHVHHILSQGVLGLHEVAADGGGQPLMGQLLALQGVEEEDRDRVHEEFAPSRVVVTLHHHEVLVTTVRIVQLLGMVRLDETIVVCCCKQRRDEGAGDMPDWHEFKDVEGCMLFDGAADHLQSNPNDPPRDLAVRVDVHELLTQDLEVGEGAVQHQACNRRVAVSVQECSRCAHRSAPEAYARDPVGLAQVGHGHC
mmetsp:Transcript_37633/g.87388  ORF Transcript_37633/g.87388 Transcript_37633/m.87388 type:complete len:223 (-) Transcript_37633:185-853(-)